MHDELQKIDLEKIRAVCKEESRTLWTTIATRNRLYQFMAMSDETTQQKMRLSLSLMDGPDCVGSSVTIGTTPSAVTAPGVFSKQDVPMGPRGIKR